MNHTKQTFCVTKQGPRSSAPTEPQIPKRMKKDENEMTAVDSNHEQLPELYKLLLELLEY